MNNRISVIVATAILSSALAVLVFSCKDPDNTPPQQGTVPDKQVQLMSSSVITMDTVPLASALANVKHYLDSCTKYLGEAPIKAYTIHANDMLMALGINPDSVHCGYTHARVYLGLNPDNEFKLYFTPVVGANLDPSVMDAGRDTILSDADGNLYVMDLNAPCPNTCDVSSPFYSPK